MEDRDVVAAIVVGDPAGLAEAYDRYAVSLYAYCRSMLREPADAADAVQDTFLVAAAKLRELRDPAKLRSWLYAVARNECLRRLRTRTATAALDDAPDVPSPSAGPGIEAERAELQQLVRSAIDGLNPKDRDVIELSLGHELDGDDLASALGVSRNHAHAVLSRARGQLERSLGALIVARTGREACPTLDAMLTGWDGQLTVLIRKRISRHIEDCEICGERKRRELTPALYAGAMPLIALVPGFRDHLLKIVADRSPAGLAHRLSVANRAGPFGPNGFPKPAQIGGSPWHRALSHSHIAVSHSHAVMAGAATSVVAAGAVVAVLVSGGLHQGPSSAAGPGGSTTRGSSASNAASARHGGPTPSIGGGLVPAALTAPAGASGSASAGGTAPGAPGTSTTTGSSSGSATSPATSSSSSSSSSSAPATTGGTTAPATVAQGTLTVSSSQVQLVSINGTGTGKFTLTATGGPVSSYSITLGSALLGSVTVSPASGSLPSGGSVTVTVTTKSLIALDGQLTVSPGGQTIAVVISLGL